MSLLGLSLFTGTPPAPSPNLNAAPTILAVTLEFELTGDAAPAITTATLHFDVLATGV